MNKKFVESCTICTHVKISGSYLTKIAKITHSTACKRGRFDKARCPQLDIMSETMELYDAYMNGKRCEYTKETLQELLNNEEDDAYVIIYNRAIKDRVESEWADVCITCLSVMEEHNIKIKKDFNVKISDLMQIRKVPPSEFTTSIAYNFFVTSDKDYCDNLKKLFVTALANCPNLMLHIALKLRYNKLRKD